MSLSIIIPTIGRPSLTHTMVTLLPQLTLDDEILIVGDGPTEAPKLLDRFIVTKFIKPWEYWELEASTEDNGAGPRDAAVQKAKGSHLMFIDDDDSYNPWALECARKAIKSDPDKMHVFKMATYNTWWTTTHYHTVIYRDPEVRVANIGTPMFVVPNKDVPKWTGLTKHIHDFEFAAQYKGQEVFHPEIIARVRS